MRIAALILTLVFGLVVGFGLGSAYRMDAYWIAMMGVLRGDRAEVTGESETIRAPDYIQARPTVAPRARSSRAASTQVPSRSSGVSMASFNQLRDGMSHKQVVEILGSEGEMVSSSNVAGIKTIMYKWESRSSSYSAMSVMFQNGRLVMKSQYGLD